jgi:hypothetical protein
MSRREEVEEAWSEWSGLGGGCCWEHRRETQNGGSFGAHRLALMDASLLTRSLWLGILEHSIQILIKNKRRRAGGKKKKEKREGLLEIDGTVGNLGDLKPPTLVGWSLVRRCSFGIAFRFPNSVVDSSGCSKFGFSHLRRCVLMRRERNRRGEANRKDRHRHSGVSFPRSHTRTHLLAPMLANSILRGK